jgi:hypothetical protein
MNILSTSADCIARGEEDELEGELQDWSAFPTQALAVGEACLRGGVKDKNNHEKTKNSALPRARALPGPPFLCRAPMSSASWFDAPSLVWENDGASGNAAGWANTVVEPLFTPPEGAAGVEVEFVVAIDRMWTLPTDRIMVTTTVGPVDPTITRLPLQPMEQDALLEGDIWRGRTMLPIPISTIHSGGVFSFQCTIVDASGREIEEVVAGTKPETMSRRVYHSFRPDYTHERFRGKYSSLGTAALTEFLAVELGRLLRGETDVEGFMTSFVEIDSALSYTRRAQVEELMDRLLKLYPNGGGGAGGGELPLVPTAALLAAIGFYGPSSRDFSTVTNPDPSKPWCSEVLQRLSLAELCDPASATRRALSGGGGAAGSAAPPRGSAWLAAGLLEAAERNHQEHKLEYLALLPALEILGAKVSRSVLAQVRAAHEPSRPRASGGSSGGSTQTLLPAAGAAAAPTH